MPPAVADPAPSAGPFGGLALACAGDVSRLPAELRQRCESRQWGDLAKRDPHDNGKVAPADIDPRKAAHYEDVLAAKHSPGHGPGFGCFLAFGGGKKPKIKRPPHSLGLAPCAIMPPQGFLTPEADVAPLETPYEGQDAKIPQFRPMEPKRRADQTK